VDLSNEYTGSDRLKAQFGEEEQGDRVVMGAFSTRSGMPLKISIIITTSITYRNGSISDGKGCNEAGQLGRLRSFQLRHIVNINEEEG
jgi:hypothetical protein